MRRTAAAVRTHVVVAAVLLSGGCGSHPSSSSTTAVVPNPTPATVLPSGSPPPASAPAGSPPAPCPTADGDRHTIEPFGICTAVISAGAKITVRLAASGLTAWRLTPVAGDIARTGDAMLSATSGYDTFTITGVHPGTARIQADTVPPAPGAGGTQVIIVLTVKP